MKGERRRYFSVLGNSFVTGLRNARVRLHFHQEVFRTLGALVFVNFGMIDNFPIPGGVAGHTVKSKRPLILRFLDRGIGNPTLLLQRLEVFEGPRDGSTSPIFRVRRTHFLSGLKLERGVFVYMLFYNTPISFRFFDCIVGEFVIVIS